MREPGNEATPHYNCNQQTLKMKLNMVLCTYNLYQPYIHRFIHVERIHKWLS